MTVATLGVLLSILESEIDEKGNLNNFNLLIRIQFIIPLFISFFKTILRLIS